MTLSVCPIAVVNAPVEQAWAFLAEPANYALWWDARTLEIEPAGHAQPGQKIQAETRALGRGWAVNIEVQGVDDARHRLELKTMLPFGIAVYNHITCTAVDAASSRVTFG